MQNLMGINKWMEMMNHFGFSKHEDEYEMILKAYSQSHLKYHNVKHINDCLQKCALQEETNNNKELHFAFWYHDVVYKPLKKDNELKSADLATKFLKGEGASQELIERIKNLIMATLHHQNPKNQEEAFMMDIDISILGSRKDIYLEYTNQIREEYKMVPWFMYKKKRKEILTMFLKKEKLYFTEFFRSKYEEQARINIEEEIRSL